MDILHYLIIGAFAILLIMYIIKTRIDNQFRKKMVPLLKKQKGSIVALEEERERLGEKNKELIRDLNIANNKISKTQDEYDKIRYILEAGVRQPLAEFAGQLDKNPARLTKNEIAGKCLSLNNETGYILRWFDLMYNLEEPEYEDLEVTDFLYKYSEHLKKEFENKKLNFVCHLGEPVSIRAERELMRYVFLTFGRLLGRRSVTGNSIYVDIEKTGKKCLISMEDSSHGPDDVEIKALFKEIWLPAKLPDLKDEYIVPVLVARDFVSVQQGNTWHSRVQEIGMKITFSIPLVK